MPLAGGGTCQWATNQQHRPLTANCTNEYWARSVLSLSPFRLTSVLSSRVSADMCASNVSHLPTRITAKDREKQYPGILHQSGGKLFCTTCNIVVEHKRKSSIDKHFATAKHMARLAETPTGRQTTRQITLTQAVSSRAIASAERIKVSYFECAWLMLTLV